MTDNEIFWSKRVAVFLIILIALCVGGQILKPVGFDRIALLGVIICVGMILLICMGNMVQKIPPPELDDDNINIPNGTYEFSLESHMSSVDESLIIKQNTVSTARRKLMNKMAGDQLMLDAMNETLEYYKTKNKNDGRK